MDSQILVNRLMTQPRKACHTQTRATALNYSGEKSRLWPLRIDVIARAQIRTLITQALAGRRDALCGQREPSPVTMTFNVSRMMKRSSQTEKF